MNWERLLQATTHLVDRIAAAEKADDALAPYCQLRTLILDIEEAAELARFPSALVGEYLTALKGDAQALAYLDAEHHLGRDQHHAWALGAVDRLGSLPSMKAAGG